MYFKLILSYFVFFLSKFLYYLWDSYQYFKIDEEEDITDEEFIAYCWQYTYLTQINIFIQIKRLARRGNTNKFKK